MTVEEILSELLKLTQDERYRVAAEAIMLLDRSERQRIGEIFFDH